MVIPANTFTNTTIPIEPEDMMCVVTFSTEADINVEITAKDEAAILLKTKTPLRSRSEVVSLD